MSVDIDKAVEDLKQANRTEEEINLVRRTLEESTSGSQTPAWWVLKTCQNILSGAPIERRSAESYDEDDWEPIYLGDGTKSGHRVRVIANAYIGSHAEEHNGKFGVFVGGRNGFVLVKYDDAVDSVVSQHRPNLVQKLKTYQ